MGTVVPQFVSRTAQAAAPGKDNILVVLEMTGGNDGLNTVIPYADDLYHKARPTLRQTKEVVIRLDDHVGLNSSMLGFRQMWEKGQLAVVQGVGYPNPERSHFEAMDIWQSADPKRVVTTGWLGRAVCEMKNNSGGVPILQVGSKGSPLALSGAPGGGAVTVNDQNSFRLATGRRQDRRSRRRAGGCWRSWRRPVRSKADDDLASFIQRRQVQTLTAVETLRELAGWAQCRAAAGRGPLAEASAHRRLDRPGVRHAHFLRQPRRLRHPRRPGRPARQPAGRPGKFDQRVFRDAQDHAATTAACGS